MKATGGSNGHWPDGGRSTAQSGTPLEIGAAGLHLPALAQLTDRQLAAALASPTDERLFVLAEMSGGASAQLAWQHFVRLILILFIRSKRL